MNSDHARNAPDVRREDLRRRLGREAAPKCDDTVNHVHIERVGLDPQRLEENVLEDLAFDLIVAQPAKCDTNVFQRGHDFATPTDSDARHDNV